MSNVKILLDNRILGKLEVLTPSKFAQRLCMAVCGLEKKISYIPSAELNKHSVKLGVRLTYGVVLDF